MADKKNWKRVASETVVLNPQKMREFATKHNALPQSPTERELVPDRVAKLTEVIEAGRAVPFNWALVDYSGKQYRMNGQHSSRALMEFPGDLPDSMVIHLDKYEASDSEAMADLFRQFDARWTQRSKSDISGAFQGLNDDIAKCARPKAKLAIEGVVWHRRNVEKIPVPPGDEIYALFFEKALYPFIHLIDGLFSIKTPEMKQSAVVAAIYQTFQASESGAQEFWRQVAINNVSDDSEPSAVLSAALQEAKDAKKPLKPGIAYAKCIKAWNAFREGTKIRSLNVNIEKGWPSVAA